MKTRKRPNDAVDDSSRAARPKRASTGRNAQKQQSQTDTKRQLRNNGGTKSKHHRAGTANHNNVKHSKRASINIGRRGQQKQLQQSQPTHKQQYQQQQQQKSQPVAKKGGTTKRIRKQPSEDDRAEFRKNICVPRKEDVPRDSVIGKDPSRGGSEGYPVPFRELLIKLYQNGHVIPKKQLRSVQRWIKDGVIPKRKTGNKAVTSMGGIHLLLLALYKLIYPQATNPQCAVFIAIYSDDGRVFTNREISKGLKKLNMTIKKASTTAYQAFTKRNVFLHTSFWQFNFPAGINNVRREVLCDADEMSLVLGDACLTYGHGVKGCRIRKGGNYGRSRGKVTIIMIIEPGNPKIDNSELGSINRPRIWYRISEDKGTSTEGYMNFLERYFLNKLRADEPRRILMHDNLSSHKSEEIYVTMEEAGHNVICRPPYRPNEAPIEFVFDQLACEIRRRWERINNIKDLKKEIRRVIDTRAGMGGFNDLFKSLGYLNEGERGFIEE